jgi:hypothetical protein
MDGMIEVEDVDFLVQVLMGEVDLVPDKVQDGGEEEVQLVLDGQVNLILMVDHLVGGVKGEKEG